jgi:release factor glutamine methyltransferase
LIARLAHDKVASSYYKDRMNNNSLAEALSIGAAALAEISDTPRLDAELLAAYATGRSRTDMLMHARELPVPAAYFVLINRRALHQPVAYITARQAFWDLELAVNADVLIPRADSETLIDAAISAFAGIGGPDHILDLGTGSGALLLAALSQFPAAHGTGMDASKAALAVAQDNAFRLGFAERTDMKCLSWHEPDWTKGFAGQFDLILCNPPYVETNAQLAPQVAEYEPHSALFAGEDGLDDYRVIMPALPSLLATGGAAILEIGHTQSEAVSRLAASCGFGATLAYDLSGNPRCLTLRLV